MTDLLALLKEARDDLHGWESSDLPVNTANEIATRELIARIDAAIAEHEAEPAGPLGWL